MARGNFSQSDVPVGGLAVEYVSVIPCGFNVMINVRGTLCFQKGKVSYSILCHVQSLPESIE